MQRQCVVGHWRQRSGASMHTMRSVAAAIVRAITSLGSDSVCRQEHLTVQNVEGRLNVWIKRSFKLSRRRF